MLFITEMKQRLHYRIGPQEAEELASSLAEWQLISFSWFFIESKKWIPLMLAPTRLGSNSSVFFFFFLRLVVAFASSVVHSIVYFLKYRKLRMTLKVTISKRTIWLFDVGLQLAHKTLWSVSLFGFPAGVEPRALLPTKQEHLVPKRSVYILIDKNQLSTACLTTFWDQRFFPQGDVVKVWEAGLNAQKWETRKWTEKREDSPPTH